MDVPGRAYTNTKNRKNCSRWRGQTFIYINGINDFKGTASKGSVYVEFDVPTNSLIQGGKDGWYKMLDPDAKPSQKYLLNKQKGSLTPDVSNIKVVGKK